MEKQGLVEIAQSFASLKNDLLESPIDMNEIARRLNVPKRRIYDVVNVLEGLGIVEKVAKSVIQWNRGMNKGGVIKLRRDIEYLKREESNVDSLLDLVKRSAEKLKEQEGCYMYLKQEDTCNCFDNKNLIAFKKNVDKVELQTSDEYPSMGMLAAHHYKAKFSFRNKSVSIVKLEASTGAVLKTEMVDSTASFGSDNTIPGTDLGDMLDLPSFSSFLDGKVEEEIDMKPSVIKQEFNDIDSFYEPSLSFGCTDFQSPLFDSSFFPPNVDDDCCFTLQPTPSPSPMPSPSIESSSGSSFNFLHNMNMNMNMSLMDFFPAE